MEERWVQEAVGTAALRRVPVQVRSREKVLRLLDAAAALLAEVGYDRTVESPTLLLERAGVTGGAFYAYFESVHAVIEALSLRYIDLIRTIFDEWAEGDYDTWEEASDAYVDAFAAKFMAEPAVRELWLYAHLSAKALAADREIDRRSAEKVREVMTRFSDTESGCGTELQYRMLIVLLDQLLRMAFLLDERGDPNAITETKTATRAYLATFLHEPHTLLR